MGVDINTFLITSVLLLFSYYLSPLLCIFLILFFISIYAFINCRIGCVVINHLNSKAKSKEEEELESDDSYSSSSDEDTNLDEKNSSSYEKRKLRSHTLRQSRSSERSVSPTSPSTIPVRRRPRRLSGTDSSIQANEIANEIVG